MCNDNQLTSLDLVTILTIYFNTVNNPDLINYNGKRGWPKQQDVNDDETNITYYTFDWDIQNEDCSTYPNVNIPDANFKNALLNHDPVIDTNNDGNISVDEAEGFSGEMMLSNKNISDLTG